MRSKFTPPTNNKRTMLKDQDWAGWYQISLLQDGKLVARCLWWDGCEWNHGPNMRRGWFTQNLGDVRGIVRLTEE